MALPSPSPSTVAPCPSPSPSSSSWGSVSGSLSLGGRRCLCSGGTMKLSTAACHHARDMPYRTDLRLTTLSSLLAARLLSLSSSHYSSFSSSSPSSSPSSSSSSSLSPSSLSSSSSSSSSPSSSWLARAWIVRPRAGPSSSFLSGLAVPSRRDENDGPSLLSATGPSRNRREEEGGVRRGGRIVCMAHPRRVKMVAQQIKREIAEMLLRDTVLKQAVLPETALGADKYLTSVATVTDVELSNDLQVAKVYVSVFGDERGQSVAIEGLKSKQGYVRSGIGRRMRLRMIPEVRFIADDSFERGSRVLKLMAELQEERERKERGENVWADVDEGLAALDFIEEEEVNKRPRKARRKERGGGDNIVSGISTEAKVQFTWDGREDFSPFGRQLETEGDDDEDDDAGDREGEGDLENDENVILID
ncbi:hypothetical protein CBR_g38914 [Chara braunii]|uniref:Ribosome-binding factor A n=1 Tax=Chara braunii TaxID=69332 RepID=A0A388LR08_CHABU|nr:hypothetical protein CBR_g38914 [Chara braunii]|eukprot:GBG84632.1 hypothetical protein CBR_g38914 [Chara braunii]